jgi:outer membrane receptor protein involved in Fe transport
MPSVRFAVVISACVGSLLLAAVSAAQTPPPAAKPAAPASQQLPVIKEQVEVVATRLPEAPHEVPASIEVIGGDTLRAMGATNLRQALALAAGVEVAPGGDDGPAGAVPEFWGLREFDAFLLVVDDIPWGGAFNPALASLNMRDVERIEVLRGSAPVTYGTTSFVGVIHVVHTAAAAEHSYFSLGGGTFKTGSGAIDLALTSKGAWKSRFGASFDRRGFKDDRTSYTRGAANYRGAKTEKDRKTWFSADLDWLTQNPASPHVRDGASLTPLTPLDANYNPQDAFLDDTRISLAFGTERPVMHDASWSLTASYSHTGKSVFRGFLTDLSNTPNNTAGFRENIDINDIYVDTHIAWARRSHVQFIAGGDYLFGNGEGTGATFTYTAPLAATTAPVVAQPTTLNLDTGSRRSFFGGYASTEWTPNDRVHVSMGARLNATVERHGEGASTTYVRPAGSVGVIFSLWQRGANHVKLFGNYRDTFKPAAFDFSLAENEGVLKPETARSYESGLKARGADGRFDLEASAFRMDFKNRVTSTVVNGLPSLQNAGTSRFQGFEVAADARGAHHVNGRVTYSFHDGKFVDFVQAFGGVNTQLGGNRVEMSARHLMSAGLIVSPDQGLVASAIVKYSGSRFLNMRNTALAPAFTTVDVGVGYRKNKWELRADGRNLGNRRDPISESEIGDAQYYRLVARTIEATLGIRF